MPASSGWIHSGLVWAISSSHLALALRVWICTGSRKVEMRTLPSSPRSLRVDVAPHVGGDRHVVPAPGGEGRRVELELAARRGEATQHLAVDCRTPDRSAPRVVVLRRAGGDDVVLGRLRAPRVDPTVAVFGRGLPAPRPAPRARTGGRRRGRPRRIRTAACRPGARDPPQPPSPASRGPSFRRSRRSTRPRRAARRDAPATPRRSGCRASRRDRCAS